jgi:hypothetical protein
MHDERILMESRSLRDSLGARTDALDKVKALELLPDGLHVTTTAVARYFEVPETVVNNLLGRHREELETNGLRVLRGAELREYQELNLRFSSSNAAQSYPQRRSSMALYNRRSVLNVAMLLRDSAIARRVRAYLLDSEERARQPQDGVASRERRVTNIESVLADVGPALRDLGPVIQRVAVRLENVERRVDHTDRVVCAMSERLADMASDLKDLRSSAVIVMTRRKRRR